MIIKEGTYYINDFACCDIIDVGYKNTFNIMNSNGKKQYRYYSSSNDLSSDTLLVILKTIVNADKI